MILLRAFAAGSVLLSGVAGAPVGLWLLRGSPLPDHVPTYDEVTAVLFSRDDGTLLLGFLIWVAWGAWLAFTYTVIAEIVARIRGRKFAPRVRGLGWLQMLVAALITAIAIGASGSAVSALSTRPPVVATAPLHPLGHGDDRTYKVRPGDTLSEIAERKLGGARKWPKIWKLNSYERQVDGRVFRDPDLIHPGWKLELPASPAERGDSRTSQPKPTPPIEAPGPAIAASPSTSESAKVVVVVEVPGGGVVSMAFAAGIGAAWAAGKLWRRKRHVAPRIGEPIEVVPEPRPEPAVEVLGEVYGQHHEGPADDLALVRDSQSSEVPDTLIVGRRHDRRGVGVELSGLSLGLTGPGAPDVARALVVDLLRQSDHYRAEIIIAVDEASELFSVPEDELRRLVEMEALPGLSLVSAGEDAIARLEELYLTRGRSMFERDADDIGALRAADPGDVLPAVVLVKRLEERPDRRLEALLRVASPYGIGGLLLGRWSAGTTCHVEASGAVVAVEGEHADHLDQTLLFHTAPAQATQFVKAVAAAHGAREVGVAQAEEVEVRPQPEIDVEEEIIPPVSLLLLGPPEVWVGDTPIPLARREKAFEMLIYLALHPGTTRKQLTRVLWPGDFPGDFHSTLRHLRDPLKEATGLKDKLFIRSENERYSIMPELVSVDLWQFRRVLERLRAARDLDTRLIALEQIERLCRGPAMDGAEFDWRDQEGWPITRAMVDALLQLAELRAGDDPNRALEVLNKALRLDPHREEIYRTMVDLLWRLGQRGEARRTASILKDRLAAFGATPDRETRDLFAKILSQGGIQHADHP